MSDTSSQTSQKPYKLDEQVGYILRLASQRHSSIFQSHTLSKLTPTQYSALIRIAEIGHCSQNHLGRLTSMDVATIKGVVDRLHKRDLVTLKPDPNDRRRTLITLSELAKKQLDDLYKVGHTITEKTLAPLSASEQQQLLKLLAKIT
ncbi:MAG: MarR family transcriptional regulator [Alphaproteobacteria bacterium]|nr:MarR family transcriptional regulator [Alphaproteobacteria bacterium]